LASHGLRRVLAMEIPSAGGQPRIGKEVRDLIRRMSFENPLWGAPKIHGELLKLGIGVGCFVGFVLIGTSFEARLVGLLVGIGR
jgi:hypothetical protein